MGRRPVALVLALGALSPAAAAAAPAVSTYDLGEAALAQDDAAFPVVPLRLQGVLGVPEVNGPAPVVVVLHGRHPTCAAAPSGPEPWPCPAGTERRNDVGLRYLVEALAGRGFLSIAVDVDAAWTLGAGEPADGGAGRAAEIVALHLARLADAGRGQGAAFGPSLAGRVDLTRLAVVGHGAGGQAAMHLAREWRRRAQPLPGRPSDGRIPVDGALLVAPQLDAASTQPQADVPTAVVLPGCDGVIPGLDGAGYYDTARLAARRASLAASIVVRGANHNAFNAGVAADDATLVATPGCRAGDPQRLAAADQRRFLADYAGAFADAVFRGIVAGGLDAFVQPPAELYGARVVTSLTLPGAQRRVVLEPRSRAGLRRDALGGRVATAGGARLGYCPPGRPCAPGLQQPSYPAQVRFGWPHRGGVLRLALPARAGDVSAFDEVALRVAVDPTAAENPPGKRQSFSVALVDAAGRRQSVVVPASQPALAWPIGVFRSEPGAAGRGDVRGGEPWSRSPVGRRPSARSARTRRPIGEAHQPGAGPAGPFAGPEAGWGAAVSAGSPRRAHHDRWIQAEDGPWGHAALGSVRVPLTAFGRVSLGSLRALELRGDRTASGALLVANVEFVDLTAAPARVR